MARIVYSGLIDSIRGSIGGTTFQSNKYGYTVKRKPNIVRPNKPLQNQRKLDFSLAVKAWQALTSGQRADWVTWASTYPQYAKHNPTAQLSGYVVFVKVHDYRQIIGEAVITAPVYTSYSQDTIGISVTLSGGVLTLVITSLLQDLNQWLVFFISRPMSVTQNFIGTRTRYIWYIGNDNDSDIITAKYTALYGSLPSIGDRVAVDFVAMGTDQGQVFARVQEVVTVAAP